MNSFCQTSTGVFQLSVYNPNKGRVPNKSLNKHQLTVILWASFWNYVEPSYVFFFFFFLDTKHSRIAVASFCIPFFFPDSRSFLDSMNHGSSSTEGEIFRSDVPASCQRIFGSMCSVSSGSHLPHADRYTDTSIPILTGYVSNEQFWMTIWMLGRIISEVLQLQML